MTSPAPLPDASIPEQLTDAPSRPVTVKLPGELQVYARKAMRWRVGCDVTVLRDGGETYTAMLGAIAEAKTTICLETYILASDHTGDRFKLALIGRARAGVKVRLMYDAVGSFGLPDSWLADLRAVGVEVIDFNPISPWRRRFRLSHRDHRKILVVDNELGFTGGLNIADDYAMVAEGGRGWHDIHCLLRGAIVLDLARLFRRGWIRAGGPPYEPTPPAGLAKGVGGTSFVRMLENTARRQRTSIRRAYLHVIRTARHSVLIQNAYFLPDRGLRRALARAVARGVDARVIVPGHSDVQVIEWASLYAMRRLAKRGVKMLRWGGVMMHAKTAVVDGLWATIGSYNFDAQSRFNNLEVTVEILDPAVGQELVEAFHGNVPSCEPFDEACWHRMPWWRKAFAWMAFRLRRFL